MKPLAPVIAYVGMIVVEVFCGSERSQGARECRERGSCVGADDDPSGGRTVSRKVTLTRRGRDKKRTWAAPFQEDALRSRLLEYIPHGPQPWKFKQRQFAICGFDVRLQSGGGQNELQTTD